MSVLTASPVILYIIGATEIMNILISGVYVIPKLVSALGTDKEITENTFASVFR